MQSLIGVGAANDAQLRQQGAPGMGRQLLGAEFPREACLFREASKPATAYFFSNSARSFWKSSRWRRGSISLSIFKDLTSL